MDKKLVIVIWVVVLIVVGILMYTIFEAKGTNDIDDGVTVALDPKHFTVWLRIAMSLFFVGSAIICSIKGR